MPTHKYLCEHATRYMDLELKLALGMTNDGNRTYMTGFNLFMRYLTEVLNKPSHKIESSELSYELVYGFMTHMSELKNWKANTWNVRLASIKAFMKFLSLEDVRFLNTYRRVRNIKSKRIPRNDPHYLPEPEIHKALENLKPNSWIRLRDVTMIQFMFATGFRASEVCNLKIDDIVWVSSRTAHIRFIGKGRKDRVIPIVDHRVYQNLKKFISFDDVNSEYVFPSSAGTRMSRSNLRDRIKRVFSILELEESITPHTLRRSAAMNWLLRGMDTKNVAANLGHESPLTTERYLSRNIEMREAEIERIGLTSKGFKRFKASKDVDEFLARIANRTKRKPT